MLDQAQVRSLLHQRPPMILLDTAQQTSPTTLTATKAITGSETCYHNLPDNAPLTSLAYPHALTLESFGQACSLLWVLTQLGPPDHIPLLIAATNLTFHTPPLPGDTLTHHIQLTHHSPTATEFTGHTHTNNTPTLDIHSLLITPQPTSRDHPRPEDGTCRTPTRPPNTSDQSSPTSWT